MAITSLNFNGPPASLPGASLEDQARCFFFQNYILTQPNGNGFLAFLPIMFSRSSIDSPLAVAVQSIGMACISNMRSSPEALVASRSKYVQSIHLVNAALRDAKESVKDETFATIVLLAMYEV
jgi:hypothetical protein